MGRAGEWWSEATIATDVECVTPARQPGSVPVGVSACTLHIAPSYGNIEYKYCGQTWTYFASFLLKVEVKLLSY